MTDDAPDEHPPGADLSGPVGHVVQRILALAAVLVASVLAALVQGLLAALGLARADSTPDDLRDRRAGSEPPEAPPR